MVRLERETEDLRETVFHKEQPDDNAENAQHARFPGEPQSCKVGHGSSSPRARDLQVLQRRRVDLSPAIAQPCPLAVTRILSQLPSRYFSEAIRSLQPT